MRKKGAAGPASFGGRREPVGPGQESVWDYRQRIVCPGHDVALDSRGTQGAQESAFLP